VKRRIRARAGARRLAVIASAVLLAGLAPADDGHPTTPSIDSGQASHEPADRVQMGPRILSRADHAGRARVLVEVTVASGLPIPPSHVTARRADGTVLMVRELGGAIPARGLRKVVFDLDLERGRVHHVFFDLAANAGEPRPGGPGPIWSTAYLRVNLDPAMEPVDRGDVLEYRALGQEGAR